MKKFVFIALAALTMCLTKTGYSQTHTVPIVYQDADFQDTMRATAGGVALKDTLIAADTAIYTQRIYGNRHCLGYTWVSIKDSGTVAGTLKVYGSKDGSTYETTAIYSTTLTNGSTNYGWVTNYSGYKALKSEVITTGGKSRWILIGLHRRE